MPKTETPQSPIRYLTTTEAAATAQVAPKTIRRWADDGRLPAHWAGRLLRIRLDELEAFLARGPTSTATEPAEEIAKNILRSRDGGSR